MHTVITRQPTPEERQAISARTRRDYASYVWVVLFSAGTAFAFGILGRGLGSFISTEVTTYVQWAGWFAGVALAIPLLAALIPYERRQRRLASRDDDCQIVQEIHVTDPRVVEIGLINDNAPILAFDTGGGTILLLQGQWLLECETYGAELSRNDEGDEFFNGLPPPHSFPSTDFTITRFPNSGEVLRIRVAGDYSAPDAIVEALRPEYQFQPSEIFSGSLDDIVGVLAREHAARTAI